MKFSPSKVKNSKILEAVHGLLNQNSRAISRHKLYSYLRSSVLCSGLRVWFINLVATGAGNSESRSKKIASLKFVIRANKEMPESAVDITTANFYLHWSSLYPWRQCFPIFVLLLTVIPRVLDVAAVIEAIILILCSQLI